MFGLPTQLHGEGLPICGRSKISTQEKKKSREAGNGRGENPGVLEAGGGLIILLGLVLSGFLFASMHLFNKFGRGSWRHTRALEKTVGRLNLHWDFRQGT